MLFHPGLWAQGAFSYVEKISSDEGLPHVFVNCFYQDHSGFLWVGTHNGLARYDGAQVKTDIMVGYPFKDHGDVTCIYEYPTNHYWVGTTKGLINWDDSTNTLIELELPSGTQRVNDVGECNGKLLVVGQKGVSFVNTNTLKVTPIEDYNGLFSNIVRVVHRGDQVLLLGRHKVICIEEDDDQTTLLDNLDGIVTGFVDRDNILWVITSSGLWKVEGEEKKRIIRADDLTSITQRLDGVIVIGTKQRGGFCLIMQSGMAHIERLCTGSMASGYFEQQINALFTDASGAIWIGTNGNGVSKLNVNYFGMSHYPHPKSSENPEFGYINALGELSDGTILAGSSGKGLCVADTLEGCLRNIPVICNVDTLDNMYVESLYLDCRGLIWMGTRFSGVYLCEVKSDHQSARVVRHWDKETFVEFGKLPFPYFFSLSQKYMVALIAGYAYLFDVEKQSLVGKGKDQRYYAQKEGEELAFLPTAIFVKKDPQPINAFSVYRDVNKRIWMGNNEGLFLWDETLGSMMAIKNGAVADVINSVIDDQEGNIWMGSRNGILKYIPQQGLWFRYKLPQNQDVNSFNPGKIIKTRSGSIVLGCNDGVIVVNPHTGISIPDPTVSIIFLDNGAEWPSYELINHSHNFSERNKIAYKLDTDEQWTIIDGSKYVVQFKGLSAGSYQLQVKGINGDGLWTHAATGVTFSVKTSYMNWLKWFLLLLLLFVANRIYGKFKQVGKTKDSMVTEKSKEPCLSVNGKVETCEKTCQMDGLWEQNEFMNLAVSTIQGNMHDPEFTLAQLYKLMKMSKSSFYRTLKSSTELSPNELIRMVRLQEAASLLMEGKMGVHEIAYEVGFNSPSYFSKSFKKAYGCSPSEYRG